MAFGLLVCKFRIFQEALQVKLVNVQKIIRVCMTLHNYCIDERDNTTQQEASLYEHVSTELVDNRVNVEHSRDNMLRTEMRKHIQRQGLIRPT
jgi:hypothetical protein